MPFLISAAKTSRVSASWEDGRFALSWQGSRNTQRQLLIGQKPRVITMKATAAGRLRACMGAWRSGASSWGANAEWDGRGTVMLC